MHAFDANWQILQTVLNNPSPFQLAPPFVLVCVLRARRQYGVRLDGHPRASAGAAPHAEAPGGGAGPPGWQRQSKAPLGDTGPVRAGRNVDRPEPQGERSPDAEGAGRLECLLSDLEQEHAPGGGERRRRGRYGAADRGDYDR